MGLEHMLKLQLRVAQDVHAALAVGQEELVAVVVPSNLVHLEVELLLGADLVRPGVDERDQILLVANRNRVSVRRPGDVDVLAFRIDDGRTLAGPNIPNANRFVAAGCAQQIGLGGVPTQLVHGAGVATEGTLLGQSVAVQRKDGHRFVERTGSESTTVAVPTDRMNLNGAQFRKLFKILKSPKNNSLTLEACAFCSLLLLCVLKCSCSSALRDLGLILARVYILYL